MIVSFKLLLLPPRRRFGDDEDDVPLHVLQVTMNSRLVRELFTEKTTHSHLKEIL